MYYQLTIDLYVSYSVLLDTTQDSATHRTGTVTNDDKLTNDDKAAKIVEDFRIKNDDAPKENDDTFSKVDTIFTKGDYTLMQISLIVSIPVAILIPTVTITLMLVAKR